MPELEIRNARIASTMLGFEDHGIFTFWLSMEWPGAGCGFGGYVMSQYKEGELTGSAFGTEAIIRLLKTVGVEKWEELKGKHVRIESAGLGSNPGIKRIGNLLEDNWLDLEELALQHRDGLVV